MKARVLPLFVLPTLLSAAPADNYVNFIRQIQQDSGLEWDITVGADGTQISPTGVSLEGSFFQLWSIHNASVVHYLLDEQFVTAYTPNATIEIATGDPYGPVPRTRVDQPFQVRISVAGLLDPSDLLYALAPDAAKWVDYSHVAFTYPEGAHSLEEISNPVGLLVEEGYMEESADTTITFAATNLTGSDLTLVEGEEVFTISAQADFGVSATILDSKKLQIWPVARGTISGFDPNEYYERIPPLTVSLMDLYPDSKTYLRIIPQGAAEDSEDVQNVTDSYVIIEDSIPQNRTLVLKELDSYFTAEGYHSLQIIHETPFGTEVLSEGSIRVDRTIEMTGGLYSGE